jgi:3'-phosphoadenosine 5'-phosphosulfate sulfotransferase (PAPS reductase)/FAD synthetase
VTAIAWWSGGVTSAVATKIALQDFERVQIYFCETGWHHPDNMRFLQDCEKWYGQKINILNNRKWGTVTKVLEHGYINSPGGAYCTKLLKKDVRIALEKIVPFDAQVFGFEYEPKQLKRAERFIDQYPESKGVFPLIEGKVDKRLAMEVLVNSGIELPAMYKLGFNNANCYPCVKGGKGYHNLVRKLAPEKFEMLAKLERQAGHSCINGVFLDELDPDAGRHEPMELPECGIYCEVEDFDR